MTTGPVTPTMTSGCPAKKDQMIPVPPVAMSTSGSPISPPVAVISCSPKMSAGKKDVKNMNVVAEIVIGEKPCAQSST